MTPPPWHHEAWSMLRARRERHAMPHALLLAGPHGLLKREFTARLVRALLCTAPVGGEACGTCRSCRLLAAGTHPDRIDITYDLNRKGEPKTTIGVEQMRALSARLAMASQLSGWQVATIDPADAMTTAAANGLLKTLEEPTPSSLLILLADAPWRLPATIRSRCQHVEFRLPPRAQALAWLHDDHVADAAAALDAAGGNPGLAREWGAQGLLAERKQVHADLAALVAGRDNADAVMRRWNDALLPQRLWFAARMVADESRARTTGAPRVLANHLSDEALDAWYERANRAREALRGPLRPDLVVLDLLARWR